MKVLSEAFSRLLQIFFGIFVFDFPMLISIRKLGYKSVLKMGSSSILSCNVHFYSPHKLKRHRVITGYKVEIGNHVKMDISRPIEIGNYVWISEDSQIFSHSHIGNTYERTIEKKSKFMIKSRFALIHGLEQGQKLCLK